MIEVIISDDLGCRPFQPGRAGGTGEGDGGPDVNVDREGGVVEEVKMMDWEWALHNPEGQFLERKSCYDRSGERVRRRDARSVARDIVETLSAMANADGGTLMVGVEDDGTPTGVDYPNDRLNVLREAPRNLVRPPLRTRIETPSLQGVHLLAFEVDWSPEAHQLTDGRYLLRVGDQNQPFPAEQIEALKAGKRRRIAEVRIVPDASLADLDLALLERLREHTGLALSDEELLLHYRLADSRNGRLVLTLAALLLFGKDPGRWHPRCGIDFVKYESTERHYGAELNIVKREWIEAPLITLIERAFETIHPHIRERQRLVDLFFEERLEYPPSPGRRRSSMRWHIGTMDSRAWASKCGCSTTGWRCAALDNW